MPVQLSFHTVDGLRKRLGLHVRTLLAECMVDSLDLLKVCNIAAPLFDMPAHYALRFARHQHKLGRLRRGKLRCPHRLSRTQETYKMLGICEQFAQRSLETAHISPTVWQHKTRKPNRGGVDLGYKGHAGCCRWSQLGLLAAHLHSSHSIAVHACGRG